ncbi:MAG: hypothetical protein H7841_08365 [Magnetospirillum sp. WYHS-4]
MSPQIDLWGNVVPNVPARPAKGYAARPGGGPQGETCKTCRHRTGHGRGRTYHKCGLVKCGLVKWTFGAGTDIKVGSPACQFWEPAQ